MRRFSYRDRRKIKVREDIPEKSSNLGETPKWSETDEKFQLGIEEKSQKRGIEEQRRIGNQFMEGVICQVHLWWNHKRRKNTFVCKAPVIWKGIPTRVKLANTTNSFKNGYDKWKFTAWNIPHLYEHVLHTESEIFSTVIPALEQIRKEFSNQMEFSYHMKQITSWKKNHSNSM